MRKGAKRAKIPPRGVEPLSGKSEGPVNKTLTTNAENDLARYSADFRRNEPDLQAVIEAWPGLTADAKEQIKRLILNSRNKVSDRKGRYNK